MPVGEFLEIVFQDAFRHADILGLFFTAELQQQAFAQVPGPDTGRFELLDDFQQAFHFFVSGFDAGPEGQVVHQGIQVPAQVAVFVQAADNERGYFPLMLVQVAETQLPHQALGKTLFDGKGIVLRPFVLAVIVDVQAIGGGGVILVDFVDGNVLGLVVIALTGRGIVIKHRIVLELTFDPLFQFLDREFDEPDGLHLQRGKPLRLLQFESLLDLRHVLLNGVNGRIIDAFVHQEGGREFVFDLGQKPQRLGFGPEIAHGDPEERIGEIPVSGNVRIAGTEADQRRFGIGAGGLLVVEKDPYPVAADGLVLVCADTTQDRRPDGIGLMHLDLIGQQVEDAAAHQGGIYGIDVQGGQRIGWRSRYGKVLGFQGAASQQQGGKQEQFLHHFIQSLMEISV